LEHISSRSANLALVAIAWRPRLSVEKPRFSTWLQRLDRFARVSPTYERRSRGGTHEPDNDKRGERARAARRRRNRRRTVLHSGACALVICRLRMWSSL
jgi:hypothetical protein